ncbi:MAG: ribose 5-phosphate isomerase B [Tenericutes bacterium]|jgi:ribose 5-phosphate isomerase B|nr:ribose 5-phosphate isomerase B [Mycoplasmatota bacterium]
MIALGSDHAGLPLKRVIMKYLEEKGLEYKDYGTYSEESVHYPVFGVKAAKAVANGECDKGIIFCGTGVGISISANKVKGIRCVSCSEPYSALMAREHNDTNMLALGSRVVGDEVAKMIVDTWLNGEFLGGRHKIRVDQIKEVDETGEIK